MQKQKTGNQSMQKPPILPATGTTGYTFLKDANGRPITELYQELHEIAVRISVSVPDPSQWAGLVAYMVASLENQRPDHPAIESTLDNICRLLTRRLNQGRWGF
jgi:hypothetical protein